MTERKPHAAISTTTPSPAPAETSDNELVASSTSSEADNKGSMEAERSPMEIECPTIEEHTTDNYDFSVVMVLPEPPVCEDSFRQQNPINDEKFHLKHAFLFAEMLLLTLSVMYVEMTVVPALPIISKEYPSQSSWTPWCLTAYNLVGGMWTPIAGAAATIYGIRWVSLVSLILYMVGQVGCALSTNIWILIVFRGFQGFGMAMFTLCFTTIKAVFPKKLVPVALGLVSSMFSVGMSIGLVGGAATITGLKQSTRWEYVFFVTLPIVVILTTSFFFTLPDIRDTHKGASRRIDILGAVVLSIGSLCILVGFTLSETLGWRHAAVLTLIIVGPFVLVGFGVMEWFIKNPLVNMRLFFSRNILLINIATFLVGFGIFSMYQLLPYVYEFNYSQSSQIIIGLLMFPLGISQIVSSPIGAMLAKKLGFSLVISIAFTAATLGALLYIWFHNTVIQTILLNILIGCFHGVIMTGLMNIIAENTTPQQFASAAGTNTLMRILGASIGPVVVNLIMWDGPTVELTPVVTAAVVSLTNSSSSSSDWTNSTTPQEFTATVMPSEAGYKNSFIMITIVTGIAILATALIQNKGSLYTAWQAKRAQQKKVDKEANNDNNKAAVTTTTAEPIPVEPITTTTIAPIVSDQ